MLGTPKPPAAAKLFVALLAGGEAAFAGAERDLSGLFGPADSSSPAVSWSVTRYYAEEMGQGLLRKFVSFGPLIDADRLAEIKLATGRVEQAYLAHLGSDGEKRGRSVNIDPGYLQAAKVVLASTKDAAHRVYLASGIYAEVTLKFVGGSFEPLESTYPDYRWPDTREFFGRLREVYLRQLRSWKLEARG